MKKLIVATIVAGAALFANASAVDWMYYDEVGTGDGYTFYIINDAGVSSTLYNYLAVDGDTAKFSSELAKLDKQSFDNNFSSEGYVYGADSFSEANSYLTIFAVKDLVADAKFYYSEDISTVGYTYDPPNAGTQLIMDSSYLSEGTIAAPEPTSGLLLLLGVAGLALRRRRA